MENIESNLKYIASFASSGPLALSDGVESGPIISFSASYSGKYIFEVCFTNRITVSAANSIARGTCNILKNGSNINSSETQWTGGATTSGDIDETSTKIVTTEMEINDKITITAIITRRGGTITYFGNMALVVNVYMVE